MTVPEPGAGPAASWNTEVAAGRKVIDEIDGAIIRLISERREMSTSVQRTRVQAGGSRQQASREDTILDRYHGELGKPGIAVAVAILDSCRPVPRG